MLPQADNLPEPLDLHKAGPYNPAAALPPKVVKKILNLEFVEMADVRADIWPDDPGPHEGAGQARRQTGKPPVNDIRVWMHCFARMAAVLVTRFPEKGPELWAYQSTILKAAHTFEGMSWVAYDRQFRREALARKDLNWSIPNIRLYNEAFTGRARTLSRCPHCLSEEHTAAVCPYNPTPPVLGWLQEPHQLVTTPARSQSAAPNKGAGGQEICRNFNRERCYLSRCRFLHCCLECYGPHPSARCPQSATLQRPPQATRGRGSARGRSLMSHPYRSTPASQI